VHLRRDKSSNQLGNTERMDYYGAPQRSTAEKTGPSILFAGHTIKRDSGDGLMIEPRLETMGTDPRPGNKFEIRVIKKYPNRRLYDTVESRYITLADIRRLVTDKVEFVVIDKKSEEDITRSILLQVIAEQEHAGEPMMSQDFLSQVIRSYGSAMQSMVGSYLEQSLKMFQPPREASAPNGAAPDPFTAMANIARQNYERWLAMQSDFLRAMSTPSAARPKETGTPEPAGTDEREPVEPRVHESHPR
jgi:polyhydroxyalkanoate synthesis repressor PhaR